MNIEIKFRAWDFEDKIMRSVAFIEFDAAGNLSNVAVRAEGRNTKNGYSDGFVNKTNGEGLKLMQFTGLKDKNGKEIYGGDVVKYPSRRIGAKLMYESGTIEYNTEDLTYYITNLDGNPNCFTETSNLYLGLTVVGEVIGNIYDRSQLLK